MTPTVSVLYIVIPAKAQGCPGKNLARPRKGNRPPFRLGRARPGHPRLGTVERKTWMRGSSPRKTTLTRCLGVPHKSFLQENFSRTTLREGGNPGAKCYVACPLLRARGRLWTPAFAGVTITG